jgi:hypothetical protein
MFARRQSGTALRRVGLNVLVFYMSAGSACVFKDTTQRIGAQETLLNRQIDGLRALIASAERGELLPNDHLVVAVSESLVRDLAALALPREQIIAHRFRVRLEKIDVRFRDQIGTVRLDGRVSPADRAPGDVFAELAVFGMVSRVDIDPEQGTLSGKVVPSGFEVKRVGMFGNTRPGRRLVERLARTRLDDFESLAVPLTIPVRLEQNVVLSGSTEGPVRISPASFPLTVSVTDVDAYGERLWITVGLKAGAWTRSEHAVSPTPSPERP